MKKENTLSVAAIKSMTPKGIKDYLTNQQLTFSPGMWVEVFKGSDATLIPGLYQIKAQDYECEDMDPRYFVEGYIGTVYCDEAIIRATNLNARQSRILHYAINSGGGSYIGARTEFEEDTRYCRGIGASCAAIYSKGIEEIHAMVTVAGGRSPWIQHILPSGRIHIDTVQECCEYVYGECPDIQGREFTSVGCTGLELHPLITAEVSCVDLLNIILV